MERVDGNPTRRTRIHRFVLDLTGLAQVMTRRIRSERRNRTGRARLMGPQSPPGDLLASSHHAEVSNPTELVWSQLRPRALRDVVSLPGIEPGSPVP